MNSQDRPNEFIVKTGNYFSDAVENICEILRREQREDPEQKLKYIRRLTEVLSDDVIIVPKPPCIAVAFSDFTEEVHTIGQRHPITVEVTIEINVFYYHSEVKDKIRKAEIRDALWEIARILRRNSDLNGLSSKGALIRGGELIYRARNDKLYEAGLIRLGVPILIKTRRGVT